MIIGPPPKFHGTRDNPLVGAQLFDLSCQFVFSDPGSFLAVCESFCESTLVRFSGVAGGRTDAPRTPDAGAQRLIASDSVRCDAFPVAGQGQVQPRPSSESSGLRSSRAPSPPWPCSADRAAAAAVLSSPGTGKIMLRASGELR